MTEPTQVTRILDEINAGHASAAERLMPLVYDELRALAAHWMRRERPDHTLEPTALVNEAYLKLVDQTSVQWQNRAHFFAVAAEIIRRLLVDHARARLRQKRGGDWRRVTISTVAAEDDREQLLDLLALDEAMHQLGTLHARHARVVELRFFGGLSVAETAHVLGISEKTVKNDWRTARAWLRLNMSDPAEAGT